MTTPLVDFEYLTAFHFQWTCTLCGATDVAAGPGTVWRKAAQHRQVCNA